AHEAPVAARIHDLFAPALDVGAHAIEIAHQLRAKARTEPARRGRDGAALHAAAFPRPLRKAAVQHGDAIVAEDAEAPPHASGRNEVLLTVDDHPDAAAAREPSHRSRE